MSRTTCELSHDLHDERCVDIDLLIILCAGRIAL